jgi:hypothetical protein
MLTGFINCIVKWLWFHGTRYMKSTSKKPTMDDIFEMYQEGVRQGFLLDTVLVNPEFPYYLNPQADWIIRLGIEMGIPRQVEVEYDDG